MADAFQVVRDFEKELCAYTGAPFAVTTTSCTMALLIAVSAKQEYGEPIEIPKLTYIGVAMSIYNAGAIPAFRDEVWRGAYQLKPLNIWDCARRFTSGMYVPGQIQCLSFHHSKILGLAAHGGAILHDDPELDGLLRKLRFDGRTEGVTPKDDKFNIVGFHAYMTPPTAAEGLLRLASLPRHNEDLPNSDYSDLSLAECFT